MRIKATIKYKVKENHPDLKYIEGWNKDKVFDFDDTYNINPDNFWGEDHINSYIRHDMELVAGGGYDTDTIEVVSYKTERVF